MGRMRTSLSTALVLAFALSGVAPASDESAAPTAGEHPNRHRRPATDDPGTVQEWARDMANRASVGVNGMLTAPADPVYFAMEGSEVFSSLPASTYTGPVVGVFAGIGQMAYRVFTGTFDFAFSWVPFLYMQSPVPRVTLLPWAEHDEG
ncbi:MAG: hypothetical protein GY772_27460 [bacterium]|nr:hypothetical protein [Deltaproteobacteria bacterium]MCP4244301.1 hypothetical protein [bacterium]MDP6074913.1 hypothetical protein [Myxococcota bacterium]MDP7300860.1 hypothetical protein [Myxococcota bacterium]HJO24788.1 hypothetical protein [Myxococcota bacterium]